MDICLHAPPARRLADRQSKQTWTHKSGGKPPQSKRVIVAFLAAHIACMAYLYCFVFLRSTDNFHRLLGVFSMGVSGVSQKVAFV